MWAYKNIIQSTNYSTGEFIPLNTKVEILDTSNSTIKFIVKASGSVFTLKLNSKHSQVDIDKLDSMYFGNTETNYSKSKYKNQIQHGQVISGMSRDEVILTRGYPPKHATSSLENNEWLYWISKWNKEKVTFRNGKVIEVRN